MRFNSRSHSLLVILLISTLLIFTGYLSVSAQDEGEGELPSQSYLGIGGDVASVFDVPGGPGLVMLSPYQFRQLSPSDQCSFSGNTIVNQSSGSCTMVAGVTLPHGANITKLTLYVFDGNPSKDITLNFARGDGSGSFMVQGGINSGIGGVMPAWGAISTTQFLNTQVDNRNYSYTVYAIVPPQSWLDLGFSNVCIDYEYATAIPILSK